ncbi:MAG: hypothetical protein HQK81_12415 [Desulfovibrionaceae bacterium]|nr:hypothetical protein [Desulfovibrionaceae bacterium]MBF0514847.1 hypothetical protein [Desulfovibrionaceae bacterium]
MASQKEKVNSATAETQAQQALASLRALSETARELTRDKQAEVEELLARARGVQTEVVELLHGRIAELLEGNVVFERRLEDLESALRAKDRDIAEAEREKSVAQAALAEVQARIAEALSEKEKLRERLSADLERTEAKLAEVQAAAKKDKEELSRQIKSLQGELGDASLLVEQLQGEKQSFTARLDALARDKQNVEKEAARLGAEFAAQAAASKRELQAAAAARDEALAAKAEADSRMAKIQEQWERIMKG